MKPEYKNLRVSDMERAARRAGIEVINGKGDHKRFRDPQTGACMVYCDREMGKGLHYKIVTWLLKAGVVFILIIGIIDYMM